MTLSPQTAQALLEAAKELRHAQNAYQENDTYKNILMLKACGQGLDLAIASAEREIQEPNNG